MLGPIDTIRFFYQKNSLTQFEWRFELTLFCLQQWERLWPTGLQREETQNRSEASTQSFPRKINFFDVQVHELRGRPANGFVLPGVQSLRETLLHSPSVILLLQNKRAMLRESSCTCSPSLTSSCADRICNEQPDEGQTRSAWQTHGSLTPEN